MPVYGWLRPWPNAEEALRHASASGTLLMIGSSSDAQHTRSNAGHVWREEEQRSYVVIPESVNGWKLFTYFEARGSGIEGTQTGVATSAMLIPLLVMWIGAAVFSARTFSQLLRKRPPQSQ